MPTVLLPSPLRAYANGREAVTARGDSLRAVLDDLDRAFPGIRFRIVDEQDRVRPHIVFYVAGRLVRRIDEPVTAGEEIMIVAALSGG